VSLVKKASLIGASQVGDDSPLDAGDREVELLNHMRRHLDTACEATVGYDSCNTAVVLPLTVGHM